MTNQVSVLRTGFTLLLFMPSMFYFVTAYGAEKAPSTQQALEQLRMLQQRMSPGADTNKSPDEKVA